MQTNFPPPQQIISNEFYGVKSRSGAHLPFPSRLGKGGFSLIEVVLALGVISFAFVALFGLLPVGLNAFNNSVDSTMESQIAESVMSQLKQDKFSQLYAEFNDSNGGVNTGGQPSFYKPSNVNYLPPATGFYYDDQGNFLALVQSSPPSGTINPVTSAPASYIYTAGVQIYYDSAIPLSVQPSSNIIASTTVNATTPQPVATVVITVRKYSSPNVARIFTGYLENNGL